MRREACCASALAILTLTAHGEAAPETVPTSASPGEVAPASAAGNGDGTSHWWSFDKSAFLNGLGADPNAGLFGLGDWHTIVDLRATGNLQDTKTATDPSEEFYSYLTDEGITVRNDGWFVLDPRLLTGTASVRFGLQQARQDAGDLSTAQDGDVTDYYLNVALLPEKPFNAILQASHAEFVTSHAGGGTTAASHS